jgi:hypothetical protein
MNITAHYSKIERQINQTTYSQEFKVEIITDVQTHYFFTPYEHVAKVIVDSVNHVAVGCLTDAGIV